MNIQSLPDDILIHLFRDYLNLKDIISISKSCTRFKHLIDTYNLWTYLLYKYPIIDFSYPFGNLLSI